jgi:hypothetical protein
VLARLSAPGDHPTAQLSAEWGAAPPLPEATHPEAGPSATSHHGMSNDTTGVAAFDDLFAMDLFGGPGLEIDDVS